MNGRPNRPLVPALLIARREWRGDAGLFVFAGAAMALAAAALAAALALSDAFSAALDSDSRTLHGGDIELRLRQREFSNAEESWLRENSERASFIATTRTMARGDGVRQLVLLKAVDDAYPLFGRLDGDGLENPAARLGTTDDGGGHYALAARALARRMNLRVGDELKVGDARLVVGAIFDGEPDPSFSAVLNAPPLIISRAALDDANLIRPGALIDRRVRLDLGGTAIGLWRKRLEAAFADTPWRIRAHNDSRPFFRRSLAKFEAFITLASLGAMLIAGVGVGNAVGAFLQGRRATIAVLKALGASGALISRAYLLQILIFALAGAAVGIVAGQLALIALLPLAAEWLPVDLPAAWSWAATARALAFAFLVTLVFSLPQLGRYARISPVTLFNSDGRDAEFSRPPLPRAHLAATIIAALLLALLALTAGGERALTIRLAAAAAVTVGAFHLLARAVGYLAARAAPRRPLALKIAARTLARSRGYVAAGVVSLGMGLAALLVMLETEANLSAQIGAELRRDAPDFYFLGLQKEEADDLRALAETEARRRGGAALLRATPYLQGRISKVNGVPADEIKPPAGLGWVLRGERGITWSDGAYLGESRIVAGEIWDAAAADAQVSLDDEAAAGLGLGLGDTLAVRVLGREITARITSLRRIDWRSFNINFVMIFSPQTFRGAPHGYFATLSARPPLSAQPPAGGEDGEGGEEWRNEFNDAMESEIAAALPSVAMIPTAPVFAAGRTLLARIGALARAMGAALIVAAALVLAGAALEGERRRAREAVILRTLGARRATIGGALLAEFAALAAAAALPAIALGAVGGGIIVTAVFELPWRWQWQIALPAAAIALTAALAAGAAAAARAMAASPLAHLRNE